MQGHRPPVSKVLHTCSKGPCDKEAELDEDAAEEIHFLPQPLSNISASRSYHINYNVIPQGTPQMAVKESDMVQQYIIM